MFRQISQGIFGEYTLIKKKTKGRTGNGISEYCNGTNFAGSPGILANVTGVPAKTRVSKSTMLCFRGNIYMRHAQIFEETERRVAKESSAVKASRDLKDFFENITILAGKNSPSLQRGRGQNPPPNEREKDDRGTLFRSLPLLKKKSRETHTLLSHRNTKSVIAAGRKVNVATEFFCAAIATCVRKRRKRCFSVEAFQSHVILSLVHHPLHRRNGRGVWVSGVEVFLRNGFPTPFEKEGKIALARTPLLFICSEHVCPSSLSLSLWLFELANARCTALVVVSSY